MRRISDEMGRDWFQAHVQKIPDGWRLWKGKIKRPSVETEGRLTIACHMKNLRKIDVVLFAGYHLVRRPDKDKN
jgi:hypothetical protein